MSQPAHLVVLYNAPKDPAAFEKYYSQTHLPLVAKHAKEIGIMTTVLVKFDANAPFYRKGELTFASVDALKKGMSTPGFRAVADDIPNFASGGFSVLTGVENP
jgi:uncharacterized protein (TIGR02118 family)